MAVGVLVGGQVAVGEGVLDEVGVAVGISVRVGMGVGDGIGVGSLIEPLMGHRPFSKSRSIW